MARLKFAAFLFIGLFAWSQPLDLHRSKSVEDKPARMPIRIVSTTVRLTRLRGLMNDFTPSLKAYLIPTGDAHQSEYISEYDARRAFISGFTGSAGSVIVTPDEALLWTDGRYYLQAENQLDSNWKLMKESLPSTPTKEKWLLKNLPPNSNVGANPFLMSNAEWEPLQTALQKAGHSLIPVENDLVDAVWAMDESQRPNRPANKIFPLPLKYSGKTIAEKLITIREKMTEKDADILIVTALDEVAHLFNLRGSDIPYNPVFYGYGVITQDPDALHLITRSELFDNNILQHFTDEGVTEEMTVRIYDNAISTIKEIIASYPAVNEEIGVWIAHGSSRAVHLAASSTATNKTKIITDITQLELMKSVKNNVEMKGMINCHIRDGAALAQYFSWLEEELVVKGNKDITEISAATELENIRSNLPDYVGLSFGTISGSGPNGAIIHYKPEPETDRTLSVDELYLCDSGAQFWDGTTDVTRTLHFGTPTPTQKQAFTLVLKGQIALGTAVFPYKIKGNVLDTLARRNLWQRGLNYAHGTGHGIGHFLNVHEGPMGIHWRQMPDDAGLEPNMFISNEPGYYENGQYGIRLEDIVRVVELIPPGDIVQGTKYPRNLIGNFNGQGALGFETVTMAPIQKKMIDISLLTEDEIQYIDNYHRKVYDKVSPVLDELEWETAKIWLEQNTKPLRS